MNSRLFFLSSTFSRRGLGVLALAMLALALTACGKSTISMSDIPASGAGSSAARSAEPARIKHAVVETARSQIGVPYRRGGTAPGGFDCSGLVVWSYRQHGISVPRTTSEQMAAGNSVKRASLQPGDILVFRTNSGLHTGIYTGRGTFIHSPKPGARVREDQLGSVYWSKAFREGRRLI